MNGLRLESFSRVIAAPPPVITPSDLDEARREGFASGRAAAADEGAAALMEALQALTAALAGAAADREAREAGMRRDMASLLRCVIARIAPRTRAAMLAERVVQELTDMPARAEPCRIRCDEAHVVQIRAALASAGIAGVEITGGSGPLEVEVPGGALRIDMTTHEAALDRLIADFAEGEN